MKIKQTTHITKANKEVIIREASLSDAPSMIECIKSYLASGMIPLTPQEFQNTIKDQEEWINKFLLSENNLLVVAEYDGEIIGNIDITQQPRQMLCHTAFLGMGIHSDWQNQGIGSLLLKSAIDWSDSNPNIEQLWLMVFGNNKMGIKIYEKMGFVEDGRQQNFIKDLNGGYIDNVIMTRRKS
ncbi:GNAT family N-acetyltransferase [Puteibacter caeruleilacunae]|nr:GNAT family N-acetyltransferase [Puteibacter caeruleilacunae]